MSDINVVYVVYIKSVMYVVYVRHLMYAMCVPHCLHSIHWHSGSSATHCLFVSIYGDVLPTTFAATYLPTYLPTYLAYLPTNLSIY